MPVNYWRVRGIKTDKTGETIKTFSGLNKTKASAQADAGGDADYSGLTIADTVLVLEDPAYHVGEVLTIAPVNISTSGENTIIAAPGGSDRIQIAHWHLQNIGAAKLNFKIKNGPGGTSLNGAGFNLGIDGAHVFDAPGGIAMGAISLTAATALVIELDVAENLSGWIAYRIKVG